MICILKQNRRRTPLDKPVVYAVFSSVPNHGDCVVPVCVGAARVDAAPVGSEGAGHRDCSYHRSVLRYNLLQQLLGSLPSEVTAIDVSTW